MRRFLIIMMLISGVAYADSSTASVYQTSDIPLLDNRFRVDFGMKRVTFIVARSRGADAVILVRPNGSKLYSFQHPSNVRWLEGVEHDIITIDNPMAGPWQALGEISGDNRIRILSDVNLKVSHIPIQLYSGEFLRIKGALYNGKTHLNDAYVQDTQLTISAHGYHRPEDDNFDFISRKLAKFNDRGTGYDELPRDGNFTVGLQLDLATGKYRFQVAVKNDVFTRSFNQDVVIFPSPVKSSIRPVKADEDPALVFHFDTDELKPESIVIRGQVQSAMGAEPTPFIVQGKKGMKEYTYRIPRPEEFGGYRVNLDLFATTQLGREIVIKMTPQAFVIPEPVIMPPVVSAAETSMPETAESESESGYPWWVWLVGGLLGVVVCGVVALVAIKMWQKRKFNKAVVAEEAGGSQPEPRAESGEAETPDADSNIDLNKLDDTE